MAQLLRIATRASQLAEAQTRAIAKQIEKTHQNIGLKTELVFIKTQGDKDQKTSLSQLGSVGVFVTELETALLKKQADVAVHSLKDLPLKQPKGLCIAAIPKRADVRDVLVSKGRKLLNDLPPGAVIGTGSPRRKAQLLDLRPDLVFKEIRGNIDTRIKKVKKGLYHGTLLALAGLKRAGLERHVTEIFSSTTFLPAPGQGALALECRTSDRKTRLLLSSVADPITTICVAAERGALAGLGGGCSLPLGALGKYSPKKQQLSLRLVVGSEYESLVMGINGSKKVGFLSSTFSKIRAGEKEVFQFGRKLAMELIHKEGHFWV